MLKKKSLDSYKYFIMAFLFKSNSNTADDILTTDEWKFSCKVLYFKHIYF